MGRLVVTVAIKGLGLGGAERLVVESIAASTADDITYQVAYVLPWKDALVPDLRQQDVPVTLIGGPRGSMVVAAAHLRRLSAESDVLHVHSASVAIVARLVTSTPIVYTEHNIASSYHPLTRQLNRWTYGRNRAVTGVSSAVVSSLTGFPGPEPVLVENGVSVAVDDREVATVRSHLLGTDHSELAIHVGNIRPLKGHGNLIEAAKTLARTRPSLMIASAGGEKNPGDLDRLRSEVRRRDLDNIVFLGSRADAQTLIAAADVFVNPSDVEGLPVSILESMAVGTPVVATDAGGVSSVVRTGETGWLVPVMEPAALAAAVVDVLEHPQEGTRRAAAARNLVDETYTIAGMTRRFEEIYRHVAR